MPMAKTGQPNVLVMRLVSGSGRRSPSPANMKERSAKLIRLAFWPLAAGLVAVGEMTYLVCTAAGLLWPATFAMRSAFPTLFPGFIWIDPFSVVLGLAWVAIYALAAAAIFAAAWNAVVERQWPAPTR